MGQGDPISALLYCLANEVRVQPVLQFAGLTDIPGGPLRNLGWIDHSSWIGTSQSDIQHVASRLPIAGNPANLFSDATKTIGLGTALQGKRVTFGRQPIEFSGMPLRIPEEGEYIWLLGRHALPHVFDRQDLRKLMASCCRAVAPMSLSTLPAHYPIHMHNAVAGGIQRWSSAIRPPLPRAMRLANLPVASVLRNFWNIGADFLPELFLPPVASSWTGLCSALPTMVLSFVHVSAPIKPPQPTCQSIYPTRASSDPHPIPPGHALPTTRNSTCLSGSQRRPFLVRYMVPPPVR